MVVVVGAEVHFQLHGLGVLFVTQLRGARDVVGWGGVRESDEETLKAVGCKAQEQQIF